MRREPGSAQALPADLGRAGRRDASTGDVVPAIDLDVPIQLAGFTSGSDTLVLGTFARLQSDLAARRLCVVPLALPPPIGEYGFIWARHRSPSRAALAFMQAVREEERVYVEQEARAAALYGLAQPPSAMITASMATPSSTMIPPVRQGFGPA